LGTLPRAQEGPQLGRMVLIPVAIPSKELRGYPKVVTDDRFCGVCVGVTKPKPTRVFEALYVDRSTSWCSTFARRR